MIHSVGEYQDPAGVTQQLIDMEYVDGMTLRQKIRPRSGGWFYGRADITHAIQIGEALQEAHSKGIVEGLA